MTATQAPTPGPLSGEQISALVQEQMHDCWYEICADTGCHPLDIVQLGRKRLEYNPGHWTRFVGDAVAARLAPLAQIGETPCLNSSCSSLSSSNGAGKSDAGSNPTAPVEVDCGTHGKVPGPICIRCAELGSPMGSADLEDKLHGTAMCPVGTVEWCGWATAEIERLRSPAPVEASGSEREEEEFFAPFEAFRPKPSGSEREETFNGDDAALVAWIAALLDLPDSALSHRVPGLAKQLLARAASRLALLSARALASGGQHSGGEEGQ